MRSNYTSALVIFAAVFAAGLGHTSLTAQAGKSALDGVYTAEQATRGEAIAIKECGSCHGAKLDGVRASSVTPPSDVLTPSQ